MSAFETVIRLRRLAKVVTAFACGAGCIDGIASEQGWRDPLGARPHGQGAKQFLAGIRRIRLELEELKTVISHVA